MNESFAEFLGTTILILLGNGAVANVVSENKRGKFRMDCDNSRLGYGWWVPGLSVLPRSLQRYRKSGFENGHFFTIPNIRNLKTNFLSEVTGTFVLVFAIGLSLGGTTGYAINQPVISTPG